MDPQAVDDTALLRRWRAGDDVAGRALVERYFDSVYRFFETKCETEADELTQSTFLACVRARDQFRERASFRTYLFTIARHELHHRLRRYQRHDRRFACEDSGVVELVTTPSTKLARAAEHLRVRAALRELPEAQQTLLELHYWQELDIPALAEIFDAPPVTIRSRLHRARAALRQHLGDGHTEASAVSSTAR